MRSLEELQSVLIDTLDVLFERDAKARLRGDWLIHMTEQKTKKRDHKRKVYVDKEAFDETIAIIEEGYARKNEITPRSALAMRKQLKELGILVNHKAAYQINAVNKITKKKTPKIEKECIVLNREALEWLVDVPLRPSEQGKRWKNA